MTTRIELIQGSTNLAGKVGLMTSLAKKGLIDPALGLLSKQGQLLAEHCIKLTPPRDQAQGEHAVTRDLSFVAVGKDLHYLEHVIEITGTATNIRRTLRRKDGTQYIVDVDIIDIGGGQIASFHNAHRDARGRIQGSASKRNSATIGRNTARNKIWVPKEVYATYLQSLKARVGWAKAGWLYGYHALGGQRAEAWVRRLGAHRGTFTDGRSDTTRPFVAVTNTSGWGRGPEADRVTLNAMRSRERAMDRYFQRMMELSVIENKPTAWQNQMTALANAAA
jgi:hypothetical protein